MNNQKVAIAVDRGPMILPKNDPAQVTTIHIYFSPTGDLSPALYIYKTAMQRGKTSQ